MIHMIRTNMDLADELLEEVDRFAGPRKRSAFITEAVQEKLARLKFLRALKRVAGAWSDERHPDLRTRKDIELYLNRVREATAKRLKKKGQDWQERPIFWTAM